MIIMESYLFECVLNYKAATIQQYINSDLRMLLLNKQAKLINFYDFIITRALFIGIVYL